MRPSQSQHRRSLSSIAVSPTTFTVKCVSFPKTHSPADLLIPFTKQRADCFSTLLKRIAAATLEDSRRRQMDTDPRVSVALVLRQLMTSSFSAALKLLLFRIKGVRSSSTMNLESASPSSTPLRSSSDSPSTLRPESRQLSPHTASATSGASPTSTKWTCSFRNRSPMRRENSCAVFRFCDFS